MTNLRYSTRLLTRPLIPMMLMACLVATNFARAAEYKYPFQDPNLPIEDRVTNLLSS